MAYRATPDDVKGVIRVKAGANLMPYIRAANMLVTARCAHLAYPTADLATIETWLAAHLYESSNPRFRRQVIGRASDEILTKVDLMLKLTHPGQQVLMIDYLGGLSGLASPRKTVRMTWLGQDRLTRYRRYGRRGY